MSAVPSPDPDAVAALAEPGAVLEVLAQALDPVLAMLVDAGADPAVVVDAVGEYHRLLLDPDRAVACDTVADCAARDHP